MSAKRLPDFLIIGAQKAGTTWLAKRLAEQQDVFLPPVPELHFFDVDENYSRGPDWYATHFEKIAAHVTLGEKTPDYFWTSRPKGCGPNDIPERIYKLLPHAKLLVVLRNPVTRAISAINHEMRGRWLSPFVDMDALLAAAMDSESDRIGFVQRGLYLQHLQRFLRVYPCDRIHTVFFEDDITAAPQRAVDAAMNFIGAAPQAIQPRRRPENRKMNSRLGLILNYYSPGLTPLISAVDRMLPEAPPILPTAECIARLYDYFTPHNEALFHFLGRRTDAWSAETAAQSNLMQD